MKLRTTCWRILELTLLRSRSGGIGLGRSRLRDVCELQRLPNERFLYGICMRSGVIQVRPSYHQALAQHAHSVKSP
jgi:hypothetical protein